MLIKDKKRTLASSIVMMTVFTAFIGVFSAGTFLTKDREFSEMENRTLEQKPEVNMETIFSGNLDDDFESYMADQILFKDAMMSLKTDCDYFSGKTYQNGVYFSKDGYLLQKYTEDTDTIDQNVSYINAFVQKLHVPVDMILAPNSICVNSDKLPVGAVTDDQRDTAERVSESLASKVNLYDPYDLIVDLQENKGVSAYYKTDHHWTASAARAVCDGWLMSAGYNPTGSTYKYNEIENFYGTLYSKAPASFVKPDTFGYYENTSGSYEVKYVSENKFSYSFIDESYLDKKDKYASFFGGNYSQIKISSNSENDEKILVIKDSYANSMVQFLADSFSEVYMIDMRYFHFDKVSELIEENGIDRVLLVYNIDFLNEDKNFIWLE